MLNSYYFLKREKIKNKKKGIVDEFKKYFYIYWSFFVIGKFFYIFFININVDF